MLIFVIGAPGSGKGTLCRKLCAEFGYTHLSAGDHLRHLMQTRRDTLEQHVVDKIQKNELMDTADLIPILQNAIRDLQDEDEGKRIIVLDGFPRKIERVKDVGGTVLRPELVLFFDCPGEIAKERYMVRALPGRDSDPDIFKKRYDEFVRLNRAVVDWYESQDILVTVDTSSETGVSYERLLKALRALRCGLCGIGESKQTSQER